jgi:hypothetical protein
MRQLTEITVRITQTGRVTTIQNSMNDGRPTFDRGQRNLLEEIGGDVQILFN